MQCSVQKATHPKKLILLVYYFCFVSFVLFAAFVRVWREKPPFPLPTSVVHAAKRQDRVLGVGHENDGAETFPRRRRREIHGSHVRLQVTVPAVQVPEGVLAPLVRPPHPNPGSVRDISPRHRSFFHLPDFTNFD